GPLDEIKQIVTSRETRTDEDAVTKLLEAASPEAIAAAGRIVQNNEGNINDALDLIGRVARGGNRVLNVTSATARGAKAVVAAPAHAAGSVASGIYNITHERE